MNRNHLGAPLLLALASTLLLGASLHAQTVIEGEQLDRATYGASYIESMDAVMARHELAPPPAISKGRQPGEQGVWKVPSRGASNEAHSGAHYVINTWGDTQMGIGFPQVVDVAGAYFAGQAEPGVWTPALRVIGYRAGVIVDETDWFRALRADPTWIALDLAGVDRIVIESVAVIHGGGWYGMDDLTYATEDGTVVVDFDDLHYGYKLTGSGYAGLTWETGSGDFSDDSPVPAPQTLDAARDGGERGDAAPSGTRAVAPSLGLSFQGVLKGDAGSQSYPPDTDGAVGPNHFVITVNRNFAIYDKTTGAEISNILLGTFLPGSNGDPRVLFDHHSQRWIVLVTDFNASATFFLAVSLTDDPTGAWYKTSFVTAQGSDAGKWPDYPTLGVDANGIYSAAYMVPGGMTIFAIDKAPLIAPSPSLGTVTAFRNLPWEGAIQPAHVYGNPDGAYAVSISSSSSIRVRRIDPPMTNPSLVELGSVSVPSFSDPPNAQALGSGTPLNTVDDRLMMSVYRNGSIWTAHTIAASGRAGCRWYEIDVDSMSLVQSGTVADSSMYYFFPSIMVNAGGHAVMGFTGSNSGMYPSCYVAGRRANDPLGEMSTPLLYKEGTAPQNNIDNYGRNRWGDYSYTTLDPVGQATFWTVQEYGHGTNVWGTYVARLSYGPPDCNGNGVADDLDILFGTSADCNDNSVPDECDIDDGTSQDTNGNGIPDECETQYPLGDMNCDEAVSPADIDGFVIALTEGEEGYNREFPNCVFMNADANGDGLVTAADIDGFVALLTGK
jgi:hypothetical protein